MKKFNSLFVLIIALLATQWATAQCTGTISTSGSGATFSFTSTNPTSAMQMHSWDFGDGTYGSGQTTSHTYTTSGFYLVTAYYGDSINMCSDLDTLSVNAVVAGGSTCSAAFNTSGNSPSFTFTPTGTPTAPPGYYSYDWDFGDGSLAYGNNSPTHTYTANGTYSVTCVLYDSIWCTNTVTNTVVVTGIGGTTCDASFTFSDSNGVYYFMASYPTATSNYLWTLSNGATYSSANPVIPFNQSGTFTMCLEIMDSLNMCMDSSCVTFTVTTGGGVTCDATFSYTNQLNTYSFVPNMPNAFAGYLWDFGDGSTSTSAAPTHTYTQNGAFTVSCSLTIPSGCSDYYDTLVFIATNPTTGSISGVIDMGTSYADYGVVFLVANDSNGYLSLVDTTIIDSMGMYFFSNVSYGTYLVKAALSPGSVNFTSYLPSYHASASTSTTGVLLWNNASDVILNAPYLNNIDIDLVAGSNTGGPGFIGGLVSQGANKVGDPISDINIMVLDQMGNPVAYTYSDNTGVFQLSGLPFGTYTVYPEVQGRTTTPITITLSATNVGTNDIRVEVNTTTVDASIATGINDALTLSDLKVYPNPVKDVLNISFSNQLQGLTNVQIMDVTGKVLKSTAENATNQIQVNTSDLQEGIYLLSIQNDGHVTTYKFVK